MIQRHKDTSSPVLLFFLLILLAVFLLSGITLPFVGLNAWNFNTYSLIAYNYTVFGYTETFFAPIVSVSQNLPSDPEYYLHHPQLLSLLQSIGIALFGNSVFVAKLPVILVSFLSGVLFFQIGKMLNGKNYGLSALMMALFVPGFYVFGRMIGQEALVLFFVLLTTYFLLIYIQTQNKYVLPLIILSIILGVFSDWPMIYFIVCLFPFMYVTKQVKVYLSMFIVAVLSVFLFLGYIYMVLGGFSDLIQAFLNRSPGELLERSHWVIVWFTTILFRIGLYINPLIVILAGVGLYKLYSEYKRTKNKQFFLFLGFLLFGLIHILLYPEGSFGHAYWIFYVIPFFVFSSAVVFERTVFKQRVLVLLLTVFFLSYAVFINEWKINETKANLFRYYHALAASLYTPPYSDVAINTDSIIDSDLLAYQFLYNVSGKTTNQKDATKEVIYSCRGVCLETLLEEQRGVFGKEDYKIVSGDGEVYIFSSQKGTDRVQTVHLLYEVQKSQSIFGEIYAMIKLYLSLPQI